jgi:hypothetical protein
VSLEQHVDINIPCINDGGLDMRGTILGLFAVGVLAVAVIGPERAEAATSQYTSMAPHAQYMIASPEKEIALAKSAAPPSISGNAEILVLHARGYETAMKGKNGFVCLVERSWDADFNDPVFWNPKIRGADCLNPEAARTVLPHFRERANWALAGLSKSEMIARTKAEISANNYVLPGAGAMAFMTSKEQRLADGNTHWHPHLMFFVARANDTTWGANLGGSPVMSTIHETDPITTFIVPIRNWSDGSPDSAD